MGQPVHIIGVGTDQVIIDVFIEAQRSRHLQGRLLEQTYVRHMYFVLYKSVYNKCVFEPLA
jgi:hypothetical protein